MVNNHGNVVTNFNTTTTAFKPINLGLFDALSSMLIVSKAMGYGGTITMVNNHGNVVTNFNSATTAFKPINLGLFNTLDSMVIMS